jgi:hypothetical protein
MNGGDAPRLMLREKSDGSGQQVFALIFASLAAFHHGWAMVGVAGKGHASRGQNVTEPVTMLYGGTSESLFHAAAPPDAVQVPDGDTLLSKDFLATIRPRSTLALGGPVLSKSAANLVCHTLPTPIRACGGAELNDDLFTQPFKDLLADGARCPVARVMERRGLFAKADKHMVC